MDKLVSLVPEIYYDLIARIVPSSILCFVLSWSAKTELSSPKDLGSAAMIGLLLIVGYALGLVLDMLAGTLLNWPNRGIFWVFGQFTEKENVWQVDVWHVIASESNAARASHLRKMMAERAMLRNLVVLSIAVWLLGGWPMSVLSAGINASAIVVLVLAYYRMEFWVRYGAVTRNGAAT
jgi:hypothetical protein